MNLESDAEGSRPNPDPTVLTTEQLERTKEIVFREISSSREIVESKLYGTKNLIDARLEAMEKNIHLLRQYTNGFSIKIKHEVENLRSLHQEKFDSIGLQFTERDIRIKENSRNDVRSANAALQSAKEAVRSQYKCNALAVAKSEATFTKQIDQIGVLISRMASGFDDKINDVRERVQAIEAHKKGAGDVWAIWFAMTGFVIGISGVVVSLATLFFTKFR